MNRFYWICAVLLMLIACGETKAPDEGASAETGKPAQDRQTFPFDEVASEAGLNFFYFNGGTGQYFFNEIIGGGGALFDMDNDGDLDIFLVQGQLLDGSMTDAMIAYNGPEPPRDRLFRNDGVNAEGIPQFVDVTDGSGIQGLGYGQGAAVGDYDHDGLADLYVTVWGQNRLYRNLGDGRFEDVTVAAGVGDRGWGVSASFADFDGDGWLDLFVGNYAVYAIESNQRCGERDYCHPKRYPAGVDRLYRNRGDGSFEDVTEAAGVDRAFGRALGVVTADLNGDGAVDVYVANDASANQLWINRGENEPGVFRFEDTAMLAGAALNETGQPEGSMGVDAGDFDGDGDEDLFMTHIRSETNTIYANQGNGFFTDQTVLTGLGVTSLPFTGFGTAWFDIDNDGWLDLFVANGGVSRDGLSDRSSEVFPFDQRNQLFRNVGGRFEDVSERAGPALELSEVSRGAMFGDIDNDGDGDIVVTNNAGPTRLLLNRNQRDSSWIGVRLWNAELKRDAYGARAMVTLPDGRKLWRRVRADASYAGANDPRILFGLDDSSAPVDVLVVWPDGTRESFPALKPRDYHRLQKGQGHAAP